MIFARVRRARRARHSRGEAGHEVEARVADPPLIEPLAVAERDELAVHAEPVLHHAACERLPVRKVSPAGEHRQSPLRPPQHIDIRISSQLRE